MHPVHLVRLCTTTPRSAFSQRRLFMLVYVDDSEFLELCLPI